MYLRINEQRYSAFIDYQGELKLSYKNIIDSTTLTELIVVEQYVCLFDNDWNIVDEVFIFLQNRLHARKLSFNTVVNKGTDLKLFYDFLQQYKLSYESVNEKKINDFIAWLMLPKIDSDLIHLNSTSKRSAKSVNRILSSVKDFYSYHNALYNIPNPFKDAMEKIKRTKQYNKGFYAHTQGELLQKSIFKIKEFDKGIRILSAEQLQVILNTCKSERDRLLFELLLFTGIRIGEALSLDIHALGVCEVGESVQELHMHSNSEDFEKGNRHRQQKSGPRDLFIPTQLMKKLSDYYEKTWLGIYEKREMEHEFFFISEFHYNLGEPLSYQAVWNRCRKIGQKCGIYFTPHDFRHTFATMLARNGIGLARLSKLLGHTNVSSTDHYIKIAKKEEIVEDLIPFYQNYGLFND